MSTNLWIPVASALAGFGAGRFSRRDAIPDSLVAVGTISSIGSTYKGHWVTDINTGRFLSYKVGSGYILVNRDTGDTTIIHSADTQGTLSIRDDIFSTGDRYAILKA